MVYIVRDSSRSPSPELCADSVDSESNLNNSAVAEVASVQGGKEGSGDTNSNSTAIERIVVLINRANVLLEKVLAKNINNSSTSAGTQTPATAATTTQVSGNSGQSFTTTTTTTTATNNNYNHYPKGSATSKKGATGGQAGSTSSSARFAAASAYASTAAKVLARSNLVPGRSQYKGYNYSSDSSSSSSSSNDNDDGLVFWKLKSTPSTSAGYGYVDDSSTLKRYLSHEKGVHQLVPLKPAAPIKATTTAAATMAEGVALNLSRSGGGARASSAANTAEEANMIKVSKTTTESKAVPTGSTHKVNYILGKSSSSSSSGPQKPPMPPGPPPPSPSLDALTDQMKKRMVRGEEEKERPDFKL